MRRLNYTESLIKEYAKRIFGFAYAKTNNHQDAEDLSQEIVLQLCRASVADKGVENMNAYIYRICSYTWSNYLRRNKPQWDALGNAPELEWMESEADIEEDFVQKELCEKLRREVQYLGKTRRDIMVLFFYDNMSGKEISSILGIPASTVRWHLHRTKNELRERIEMTEHEGIYKPVRLKVGPTGLGRHYGLADSALMQNICWVCREKALSIEEISRTLGVAAFYLEDIVDKLLSCECMKKTSGNKVQTDFFIPDAEYQTAVKKFQFDNMQTLAERIDAAIRNALPEIRRTGFVPPHITDNILLWAFVVLEAMRVINRIDNEIIERSNLHHSSPMRSDGLKGWVRASLDLSGQPGNTAGLSERFLRFFHEADASSVKLLRADGISAWQADMAFLSGFRDFGAKELTKLRQVYRIIQNKTVINDYDKEIIADLIRDGYVSNAGNELRILVPYFTATQMDEINEILERDVGSLIDAEAVKRNYDRFINEIGQLLPPYVNTNERNHLLTSFFSMDAMLWTIMNKEDLRKPSEEEKKRICTLVWEQ